MSPLGIAIVAYVSKTIMSSLGFCTEKHVGVLLHYSGRENIQVPDGVIRLHIVQVSAVVIRIVSLLSVGILRLEGNLNSITDHHVISKILYRDTRSS